MTPIVLAVALLALACGCWGQQRSIGLDVSGNLIISSASNASVLANGMDFVQTIKNLTNTVGSRFASDLGYA